MLAGFYCVTAYELRKSPAPGAPAFWPSASPLPHSSAQPTLLVFLHPRCPCSRATLDELARVLHEHPGVAATAVFVRPEGVPGSWEHDTLWRDAGQIPGLKRCVDEQGREAQRFDAAASGHTLIYRPDGRLVFEGGLTASRGHYGANLASDAALAALDAKPAAESQWPVYGCPLLDEPKSCCKAKSEP